MGGVMAAEKIKALRAWMKKNGVQAYILPHEDRFQSEDVAPRDQRLAWLTGFTGSAGVAVVTQKKALLFTDGRYELQAPQQVGKAFDVIQFSQIRPMAWLQQNMKPSERAGFDPWLFTVAQIGWFQKAAGPDGYKLVPLEENPVDLLWKDRPFETLNAAEIHAIKYAGVTRDQKIKKLIAEKSKKTEALLVSEPSLVSWLLNVRGRDVAHNPLLQAMALVEKDGHVTLFTQPSKITAAMRKELGNHVTLERLDDVTKILAAYKKPVQIDPAHTPYAIKAFCDANKIPLIQEKDPGILARAVKNKTEIKGAKTAQQKDRKAFDRFLGWYAKQDFAKAKITELDIMAALYAARAKDKDFVEESFNTIAGYGPNGAIVHYAADEKSALRLKPNSLLLLDSGGQYHCGTTDITRTLAVGKPTNDMRKHYTAVLKGLIALSTARFPVGTTGAQLDALARAPLWALGLNYTHGTGHGVGSFLGVHEGPQGFSPMADTPLKPGMIISVEPGLYLTGKYGIRLENLVVVTEDKKPGDLFPMLALETLTRVPFDDALIDWSVLSSADVAFLKGFDNAPPKTAKKTARRKRA